jgi:hypothetical protein
MPVDCVQGYLNPIRVRRPRCFGLSEDPGEGGTELA